MTSVYFSFGKGLPENIFSPVALTVTLIAGILICVLPRNKAIVPFLLSAILLPIDQVVVVGPLHFPMLRILLLFGFARLLHAKFSGKDKIFSGGMNAIDTGVIILALFIAVNGILLSHVMQEVIFQSGNLYTTIGIYFLLRFLIRDEEDMTLTIRALVVAMVVVSGIMICEVLKGWNPVYALLGGTRAFMEIPGVRGHQFRATGPFDHPLNAGTFGGIMMPLFIGLWLKGRDWKYASLGVVAATVVSFAAGTSTAIAALIGGVVAFCLWPFRRNMSYVRWGVLGILGFLQMVMTSPVWHLIEDLDLTGNSSSYHRYMLVDQCIRHFWDWVLIGTKSYPSWGWDMWDLANEYVKTADTAGLIPLAAFLAVIVYGFKYLGRARQHCEGDKKHELFIWAIGASLFANVCAFFGVDYYDQVIVAWYVLLAIISTVTMLAEVRESERWARFDLTGNNCAGTSEREPNLERIWYDDDGDASARCWL